MNFGKDMIVLKIRKCTFMISKIKAKHNTSMYIEVIEPIKAQTRGWRHAASAGADRTLTSAAQI